MRSKLKKITPQNFYELLEKENSDNNFVDIVIKNYEVDWAIYIKDNNKRINISNCKINWWLYILWDNNTLHLGNSEIDTISINKISSFTIYSSKIWSILLSKDSHIDFLMIWALTKYNSSFVGYFMFGWCKIDRWSFHNLIIQKLNINWCKLEDIIFSENVFIEEYSLSWNHKNNWIIHNWVIFSELKLESFIWWDNISFINCQTWIEPDFKEWKDLFNEIIEEDYIKSNKWLKKKYIWTDDIKISIVKHEVTKKEINIKKSNLDKTQFHNCNFKNADIYIENSSLSEIVTTNFILPKNIKSNNIEWERENYRQLKYNFWKQWDSYNALIYYKKEMNILFNISNISFNVWDFIILGLWKLISWNWTNWLIALSYFILSNAISFLLFLYISWIDFITLSNYKIDYYILYNLKFSYFLSDISYLKWLLNWAEEFSSKSELLFYLTKIINFILIYQLLISFKKFNKQF